MSWPMIAGSLLRRMRNERETIRQRLSGAGRNRLWRAVSFECLEDRNLLSDLPYLGWNYVSYTSGEFPTTTSWVPQDAPPDAGFSDLRIADGALTATADVVQPAVLDGDNENAEMFIDLRYRLAHPEEDGMREVSCGAPTQNLENAVITVELRLDSTLFGDPGPPAEARNGTQIFLKSAVGPPGAETWGHFYGEWHNYQAGLQTIVLRPSTDAPADESASFDLTNVAHVGIKLGTNTSAVGRFQGDVDVTYVRIQYDDGTSSRYEFDNTEDSIATMAQTGANTVAVVDHWFVDRSSSPGADPFVIHPDVYPVEGDTQQYPGSPSPAIEQTIDQLHSQGLKVHLKPHLDLEGFAYVGSEWRGLMRPAPGDEVDFFDSYETFIDYYAGIAERTHAEGLVLETELFSLDTDPALRTYWEGVIDSVRGIYSGELIVATHWDNYQNHAFVDLVDLFGIDAYFPLTGAADPSKGDLVKAWRDCQAPGHMGRNWAREIAAWSREHEKPFYFSEIGIQSRDGAAEKPDSDCETATAQFNEDLQVAYYEAALEVFSGQEYFNGLLGWAWYPWSDAGGIGDIGFTPQNKQLDTEAPNLFAADYPKFGANEIGGHRGMGNAGYFIQDVNGNGTWDGSDRYFAFGDDTDTPIIGDWNSDGYDQLGTFRNIGGAGYFIMDYSGNGAWDGPIVDRLYAFGDATDTPVTGDWDGDGDDEVGTFRTIGGLGYFIQDYSGDGSWGPGDRYLIFGKGTDTPIIGDWDGDGDDEIGTFRNIGGLGYFILDLNSSGAWDAGDVYHVFGGGTDTPVIGDWEGDGVDQVGVHRDVGGLGCFIQDYSGDGAWGAGDEYHFYLEGTDTPIIGNWAPPAPLMTSSGPAPLSADVGALTAGDLAPVVAAAIDNWSSAVPLTAEQSQTLRDVDVQIADLPGGRLGQASGNTITLDVNAAGYGWFVDDTPWDSSEFEPIDGTRDLTASAGSPAENRFDLLTALVHEYGHVLGYGHQNDGLMDETLSLQARRGIDTDATDGVFRSLGF